VDRADATTLRKLLTSNPVDPKRHGHYRISDETWFHNAAVRKMWSEGSPQLARVMMSVLENPSHFELSAELRTNLRVQLRERGYVVPETAPRTRAARIASLWESRLSNVAEADLHFERLVDAAGQRHAHALIGVIDGGFHVYHPALQGKIYGECVDGKMVYGKSFIPDDPSVMGSEDDGQHGTHVTGIATRSGSKQIQAIVGRVKLPSATKEVVPQIIEAIRYEASHGARVINMSLSVPGGASELVIAEMRRHPDVLFVIAAGNDSAQLGTPGFDSSSYLAAHSLPNLEVVASATPQGFKARSSNFSKKYVTSVARGVQVNSLAVGAGFQDMSGTSMASPFDVGLYGELLVLFPKLSPAGLRRVVRESVTPSEFWDGLSASGGVVNERKAQNLAAFAGMLARGMDPGHSADKLRLSPAEEAELLPLARELANNP
jgi:hypothetical protein